MLSQKAFSVYCDYEARDAAARNEQLRLENKSLEAVDRTIFNFKLTKNLEVLKDFHMTLEECSFHTTDEEEEPYFVYAFDDIDSFPLEEFRGLNVTISGVTVPTQSRPSLTVSDDDIVSVEIKFSTILSVFGILENFSGTIEQVKYMIRCNHTSLYFGLLIGAVDAETGQPVDHGTAHTNYLEGSTFLVKSIKIRVHAVKPALYGLMVELVEKRKRAETEEDDLQNLSKASMNHYGLRKVAEKHKLLTDHNRNSKFFRDMLNCIAVRWLEDSSVCRVERRLEDHGRRGISRFTGLPEWVFEDPGGFATIPISSIRTITIIFAGTHWNEATAYVAENGLVLEFSPAITAIFVRDDELDSENIDIVGYIRHILTPRNSNIISNYQGPEPELTMRLMRLRIKLSNISNLMNALGVDCTSVEDE